jgi:hypothetical protein
MSLAEFLRGAEKFADYAATLSCATADFDYSLQFARFFQVGSAVVVQFFATVSFAKGSGLGPITLSTPSTVKGAASEHALGFCSFSDSKIAIEASTPGPIVAGAADQDSVELRPSTKEVFSDGSGSVSGTFIYLGA